MKRNKPKPKSILSIDVGKKRIGLAGCDPLGITIKRLPPLHRKNFKDDLEALRKHCLSRNVKGLIVGLPLDKDGNTTVQANYCKKYALEVAKALDLPLALVNEYSSSLEAIERFKLRKDRSGILDSAAAAIILEQWLTDGPEVEPVEMAAPINSPIHRNDGSCQKE